jgi:hypothetical protein
MYLLYSDETNVEPSNKFFIYVGVSIPAASAAQLSADVEGLRTAYGYQPNDLLKFNVREKPPQVSPEWHRDIKRRVIEAAASHGAVLFGSFALHQIAKDKADARRYGINLVSFHFDCYLNRVNDYGLVLIDRFQDDALSRFLREKLAVGLVGMPYSETLRMERILGWHLASIGSSHFCSVVDIITGALRYAINSRTEPTASVLLAQLAPLMLRTSTDKVDELSLCFSPKTIKHEKYLEEYTALAEYLGSNGLVCAQQPA